MLKEARQIPPQNALDYSSVEIHPISKSPVYSPSKYLKNASITQPSWAAFMYIKKTPLSR
jgi:hypothetical protein